MTESCIGVCVFRCVVSLGWLICAVRLDRFGGGCRFELWALAGACSMFTLAVDAFDEC